MMFESLNLTALNTFALSSLMTMMDIFIAWQRERWCALERVVRAFYCRERACVAHENVEEHKVQVH